LERFHYDLGDSNDRVGRADLKMSDLGLPDLAIVVVDNFCKTSNIGFDILSTSTDGLLST